MCVYVCVYTYLCIYTIYNFYLRTKYKKEYCQQLSKNTESLWSYSTNFIRVEEFHSVFLLNSGTIAFIILVLFLLGLLPWWNLNPDPEAWQAHALPLSYSVSLFTQFWYLIPTRTCKNGKVLMDTFELIKKIWVCTMC
jgi:hypothetical protein